MSEPKVTFRSDIRVRLVRHVGSDRGIAEAAWVTDPDDVRGEKGSAVAAVINAMMRGRHGTPFEHGSMTFHVEAPIFVFREWHRHRVWSFNETSARYKVMKPEFYIPHEDRPCVEPSGFKPMRPELTAHGDSSDRLCMTEIMEDTCETCWDSYTLLIKNGVAREVARNVLPVGIYSSMHATCNPRSLMAFLSLRTRDEGAATPSYPQWEIEQAARAMEDVFAELFPLTYQAFNENRRVAP